MKISLEALITVDTIERKGSFAAAAETLHRVPSAITYTVQKLEQDLGVQIFDRSGHRAILTEAGKTLLRDGRKLLHAADNLEQRVQRVATGWEAELRIAIGDLLPMDSIYPLLETFYQTHSGTHIRLLTEVYGGTWDALAHHRADLAIGAPGEGPSGGGYATQALGWIPFDFVVAPHHPLAKAEEPISSEVLIQHRAIAAADSSRQLLPRTSSLLSGQDVLTMPDIYRKCEAQRAGLGIGSVPRHLIEEDVREGRLVVKEIEGGVPIVPLFIAWHSNQNGKALQWFIDHLNDGGPYRGLLEQGEEPKLNPKFD